mgnify:CR=1 FL=1
MSFGLAFAQGLVGGFTKNIEREQIARDADDQRLAGLQDMVLQGTIKSAQDGTPMPKQIGDILRKAREDVSNRPDIGPFGRGKADPLNLEFAELSANLNSVNKFGRSYGTGKYQVGFKTKREGKVANYRDWLSEVSGYKPGDANYKRLLELKNNQPLEWNQLVSDIKVSKNGLYEDAEKNDPNKLNIFQKDYSGTLVGTAYEGLHKILAIDKFDDNKMLQFLQGETTNTDSNIDDEVIYDARIEAVKVKQKNNKKRNFSQITTMIQSRDGFKELTSGMTDAGEIALVKKMAESFGEKDHTLMLDTWIHKHANLPDLEPATALNWFKASIVLANSMKTDTGIRNIEQLDPDKRLFSMDKSAQAAIWEKMKKVTGNDTQAMIWALSSWMEGPDKTSSKQSVPEGMNARLKTINYSKQGYVEFRLFGESKGTKFNFQTIEEHVDNNEKVVAKLVSLQEQYKKIAVNQEGPLGYNLLINAVGAIVGPNGLTGALFSDLDYGTGDNTGNNDQTLTKGYIDAQMLKKYDNVSGTRAAEINAARISLAFSMARAADPSGRLSNQDIELQMVKLGGDWTQARYAIKAIDIAMEEFIINKNKFDMIVKYGKGTGPANMKDFKVIDSVIAVDTLRKGAAKHRLVVGSVETDTKRVYNLNVQYTTSDGKQRDRYILIKRPSTLDKQGKPTLVRDRTTNEVLDIKLFQGKI